MQQTRMLLSLFLAAATFGCQQRPRHADDMQPMAEAPASAGVRQLNPHLQLETDEQASRSSVELAVRYHEASMFADEYRVLQDSRLMADGGFWVRFGTSATSVEGVRYYFNKQGEWLMTQRRRPDPSE